MQRKRSQSTLKTNDGQAVKKSKLLASCSFLDANRIQLVRDASLFEVSDVENLILSGNKHHACPYYVARNSLSDAQVKLIPKI